MSGGTFEYLQNSYKWIEAIEKIKRHIEENPYDFTQKTLMEFQIGLDHIELAKIYLQRIDWLLAGDDGEENFHNRLQLDLEKTE